MNLDLHERRFIEVETPMMHAIAGGATAVSQPLGQSKG
jgi:lysyl-tRNA synthetase class II